jgi:hypothetical protein
LNIEKPTAVYALVLIRVPTTPFEGFAGGDGSTPGSDGEPDLGLSMATLPWPPVLGRTGVGAMCSMGTWLLIFMVKLALSVDKRIEAISEQT